MSEKILILHIPVIHKGFLDFLRKYKDKISKVYLIDEKLLNNLSEFKPDIASLPAKEAKGLLEKFGFKNISILSLINLKEIKNKELIFIENEISRNLYDKYLKKRKAEWVSVFLRWDKEKVLAKLPVKNVKKSKSRLDVKIMKEACKESRKSSDWWRQVGAVLAKNGKIIARSYNQGVPTDNSPYQMGSIRDFFEAGENQELSPTIHAEQKLIAEAARNGIKLKGLSLYLTHFPCSLCAKLIAWSGIKNLYFSEGASNLDAQRILKSAGVKIRQIPLSKLKSK